MDLGLLDHIDREIDKTTSMGSWKWKMIRAD